MVYKPNFPISSLPRQDVPQQLTSIGNVTALVINVRSYLQRMSTESVTLSLVVIVHCAEYVLAIIPLWI